MKELSRKQIERQDYVDNAIFKLLRNLNVGEQDLEWDIEVIADVRERIYGWLVERYGAVDEMAFYPYIET
ncbi:MAG: hypothetical protein KAT58_02705 [candidate division Zixibacteria bacterium]|nr:hypothetical protein [candidate division Zixibacteria bacterium]